MLLSLLMTRSMAARMNQDADSSITGSHVLSCLLFSFLFWMLQLVIVLVAIVLALAIIIVIFVCKRRCCHLDFSPLLSYSWGVIS